jgi:hypothetical protein
MPRDWIKSSLYYGGYLLRLFGWFLFDSDRYRRPRLWVWLLFGFSVTFLFFSGAITEFRWPVG